MNDRGFAVFINSIQQELPENQKLSVFDVLTFCEIRDGFQPKNKEIAHKLFTMGYLEKRGKTSAVRYILPRRYYELTNNIAEYSSMTDWNEQQVLAVLLPYLSKYGKAKKSDIFKIIGPHISETQLRRVIERLSKPGGPIVKAGKTINTTYSISPSFKERLNLLQTATEIGLTHLMREQNNDGLK